MTDFQHEWFNPHGHTHSHTYIHTRIESERERGQQGKQGDRGRTKRQEAEEGEAEQDTENDRVLFMFFGGSDQLLIGPFDKIFFLCHKGIGVCDDLFLGTPHAHAHTHTLHDWRHMCTQTKKQTNKQTQKNTHTDIYTQTHMYYTCPPRCSCVPFPKHTCRYIKKWTRLSTLTFGNCQHFASYLLFFNGILPTCVRKWKQFVWLSARAPITCVFVCWFPGCFLPTLHANSLAITTPMSRHCSTV